MNQQIELRLPAGIRWTSREMILPEGLMREQWVEAGRYLRKAREAVVFWETNWLQYGRKNFGDEVVREAAEQLEIEFGELKAMESLNKLEVRDPALSPEHHFVLSKVKQKDVTGQRMWAELAVKHELSAAELQESIKKGVVTRIESMRAGHATRGLATFEGLRQQWEILQRQIAPGLAEWTEEEARTALELLAPIVEFAAEMRARFLA
ncbi:MAG: hypothetical protein H0X34_20425 [Chthoniobacterales bacterium]|nr:hypothetical protein [Chthoniobacterales bacterium]